MKFKNADNAEYQIVFRKPDRRYYGADCDGYCTDPDRSRPKIVINPHRTDQTQLNTIIHETAHAFFWDKSEKEITKYADAVSRILYSELGWRKIKNDDNV